MRKRIMASIAAGFLIVAALAGPAAAGDGHNGDGGPKDCPKYAVCFWTDHYFEGKMSVHYNPGPNCDKAPHGKIGSVVNNLDEKVWLFKDKKCKVLDEVVKPYTKDKKVHAKSWI